MRVLNLLLFPETDAFFLVPDSTIYLELRDNLLQTGAFLRADGVGGFAPEIERVPGYPLLLAFLSKLGLASSSSIIWFQTVLDAFTVVVIAALAAQISPRLFLTAGVLAVFWPNLIVTSTLVLNDTLFNLLFCGALLAFARYLRRPSVSAALIGGGLFGLSLMVRPVFQFLPPVLLAVAFLSAVRWHRTSIGRGAVLTIILAVAMAVPVAPHLHRNLTSFGTVSLTSQGGTHLLGWVLPLVKWHADGTPYDAAFQEARSGYLESLAAEGIDATALSSFEASARKSDYVVGELGKIPFSALAEAWIKGAILNVGVPAVTADSRFRTAREHSLVDDGVASTWMERLATWVQGLSAPVFIILVFGAVGSLGLSLLQLAGGISLARAMPWIAFFGVSIALYVLLIMGPVVGAKYRLPFVAVEIVFAARGIHVLFDCFRRKDSQ